jgi:hypothetical protein
VYLIIDLNVQVAVIPGVWRARESSGDLFPCRNRYGVLGIEDGLSRKRCIEQGVLPMWRRGLTSSVYMGHVDQC